MTKPICQAPRPAQGSIMVSTSIIALILAGPPSPAPDFADRLDHVELAHDDSDFQFIGVTDQVG